MTRVLSALVLLPIVIGAVWFLPPIATLVLALLAAVLAFVEYAAIAEALGAHVPRAVSGVAVLAACAAAGGGYVPTEVVLMTALITIGALAVGSGQPGPAILRDAAAALFPAVYIGLPLGALAAVHVSGGREAVLLLMVVIIVSDSAQYYTGRAFGRRPLSPSISPKKTLEGAIGGLVFGTATLVLGGRFVFPATGFLMLALVGATVVGSRDRRRSVRVAAEAERRREGLRRADSRPRRHARSHRQLAVRRARLLRLRPLPAGPVTR